MPELEPPTPSARTAHEDTFARDNLPPRALWPETDTGFLGYPARLNAAVELLDRALERGWGERTAVVAPGERWSYAELAARVNRIAHALSTDLGVRPGNRVLVRGPNSPMMAATCLAVLKAGGVLVATMPLLRQRELSYIAEKARIGLALTDARLAEEMEAAAATTPVLERVVHFQSDAPDALESLAARHSTEHAGCDTAADDVALIAFTSGTTGQAKGTVHFHRDLLAICDCFPAHVLKPREDDLFCGSPPLAFTFGLGGLLLFPLRVGAATLLLEQAPPPRLLEAIQEHRATVCFTAPTAYRAMAGMAGEFDLSSLRRCVSAGEPLPLATFQAWEEVTGLKIIDGIGATEMLHIFISAADEQIRPGATGRAVPGYAAKVVDMEGHEVRPGEIGRLAVRGPTGCRYLADPERQEAYVQNGWNLTGDTYRMDGDGYFWYQARSDDMIISAGYNIAGPEVENVLLEHAAVAECAVIGVPDEERGQVVKAFVVLREGESGGEARVLELQEFVKARLAPYKYPRQVEFVASLPRTQTGKLQRFALRERAS